MASSPLLEQVDFVLQDLRSASTPFGGLFVLLTGDWLQLPAVVSTAVERNAIEG